jgi:hypothetical protein
VAVADGVAERLGDRDGVAVIVATEVYVAVAVAVGVGVDVRVTVTVGVASWNSDSSLEKELSIPYGS